MVTVVSNELIKIISHNNNYIIYPVPQTTYNNYYIIICTVIMPAVFLDSVKLILFTFVSAPFLEQATVSMVTNFTGTLNITRALIPILRPHSRIVNVSSSMLGALSTVQPNIQVPL